VTDRKLTPHFSLFQATATNHSEFQAENRLLTHEEEQKVIETLELLELIQIIVGEDIDLHSLRRCLALNRKIGSSDLSQHLLCEAADISPRGPDTLASVKAMFDRLVATAQDGRLKFGQLLLESETDGREGRRYWIHVSTASHRDPLRCGEYFRMENGKRTSPILRIKEII
jgi:hypothetical protein